MLVFHVMLCINALLNVRAVQCAMEQRQSKVWCSPQGTEKIELNTRPGVDKQLVLESNIRIENYFSTKKNFPPSSSIPAGCPWHFWDSGGLFISFAFFMCTGPSMDFIWKRKISDLQLKPYILFAREDLIFGSPLKQKTGHALEPTDKTATTKSVLKRLLKII